MRRRHAVEIPGLRLGEPIALEVFPVTTAWTAATVGWATPWTQPGGDYDVLRGAYTRAGGDASDQPARFNVSSAIRAIVNEGQSDYGLILMPSRHAVDVRPPSGLPETRATGVRSLNGIQLVVFCTLPERPE